MAVVVALEGSGVANATAKSAQRLMKKRARRDIVCRERTGCLRGVVEGWKQFPGSFLGPFYTRDMYVMLPLGRASSVRLEAVTELEMWPEQTGKKTSGVHKSIDHSHIQGAFSRKMANDYIRHLCGEAENNRA